MCWYYDECFDVVFWVFVEVLDYGDVEVEGFVGFGFGLFDDVLVGEVEWDGLFLDWEGVDDVFCGECVDDVLIDVEISECCYFI